MDSIAEIKKAVSAFQNETAFLALRKRWQTDFDLGVRLKPYDAGEGYYSYTSDSSKLLVDKAIEIQNKAKLIIRIPDEVMAQLGTNDREIGANVERFCYGSLALNDERLVLKGFPPLREQLSWFLSLRGSVFLLALMNKDDDGNTIPEITCFDPYNVAYGRGKKGLEWVCHIYKTTKEQAEAEFGTKAPQKEPTIYDFYDTKYHRVIVESEWAKDLDAEEHGLDHCPVFEIKVGSMPPISQKNYSSTNVHRGEGILAASRNLYPLLNKTLSDLLTLVRRGVRVPLGIWSSDGQVTLDKDVWQVKQGAAVSMRSDVVIKPLIEPTMPGDTAPLLEIISGEIQRAGFPHTTYGQLGFRLSGFAISQLSAAIETIVSAFIKAQKLSYETACRWLLQQYAGGEKGFNAIKVFGRTSKGEVFGMPEVVPIRPGELKGNWRLEVELEPILPKDDAQRYALAQTARQPGAFGDPLLSDRTIRDMIVGVQDPDLEQEIIDSEWSGVLPLVRLLRMYFAQLKQGDIIGAQATWMEIQRQMMAMPTAPGRGGGGVAPTALEEEAAMTPGVGTPTGPTGMPPEVMPPEQTGAMPPGAMQARMPGMGGA